MYRMILHLWHATARCDMIWRDVMAKNTVVVLAMVIGMVTVMVTVMIFDGSNDGNGNVVM